MTTDLLETIKDGVAILTMNRPDRLNAMSRPMLVAMLEALHRLAEDPNVGAVVLTGAGRGFCAGGDVKAMAEGTELGGTTLHAGDARNSHQDEPCVAGARCPARSCVLSRANSAAIAAPCVLVSHAASALRRRRTILKRVLRAAYRGTIDWLRSGLESTQAISRRRGSGSVCSVNRRVVVWPSCSTLTS